jgi:hypothetical protein
MTVPSTARRAGPFTGTGSAVNYPFTFKVFSASDVGVTTADTNGLETTQTLGSGFSISLNADQDSTPGGYVRYAVGGVDTALPSGYRLAITGDGLPFEQAADLPQGGNFDPVVIENALDALEMQIQNLRDKVTRSVTVGVTSPTALALPAPVAGQLLGWNATLDGLVNYAPDASSAAGLQVRLANTASVVDNASLIGWLRSLAYTGNTVGRWLKWLFTRSVDVTSYATGGTGTSADPWTGWDTAITWAARTSYVFGDGYYAYATSPNFAFTWLELRTTKATVLQHTGTGYALLLDGGAAGDGVYFLSIKGGGKLESNASATGGMYVRAVHHWDFDISFRNIPGRCIETHWSVHCRANITKPGALAEGQTVASSVGAYFDRRGVGETTTAWHINNPRIYGCTAVGFDFVNSADMKITNGAVEQAPLAIRVSGVPGACYRINLDGIDLEGNTKDMEYGGFGGVISGINSTTRADFVSGARANVLLGGMYNHLDFKAGSVGNLARGVSVAQDGGVYADAGTDNVIEESYNATSGATFGQASRSIASAATLVIPRGVRKVVVTGTTNITAISMQDNTEVQLVFAGVLTIGDGQASIIHKTPGNIVTSNNFTITYGRFGANTYQSC